MTRLILLYALALAVAVTALEWLEYRYVTRAFSTEIYIVLLAAAFALPYAFIQPILGPVADALGKEPR